MNENTQQNRLFGAILLVAGCCIGAGMLALPILSGLAGFTPSITMFVLSWLFMLATGFLLLEVNLLFPEDVSLITMAGKTLGWTGKLIAWTGFLFLFYALMVAYLAAIGTLLVDFSRDLLNLQVPLWAGSVAGAILLGATVYMGTEAVDKLNRFLMLGLIISYATLLSLGMGHVDYQLLKHRDWSALFLVVPAMILSFGYHNLIPSLKTYLKSNLSQLRLALFFGTLIPLIIYLLWEWLVLGLVSLEGEGGIRYSLEHGDLPTRALKGAIGNSGLVDLAQVFAFFAIVTSFLGVALSFIDFLADGLHIRKTAQGRFFLSCLVLAIPTLLALLYPKIFLTALNYAGSFGAVILFALLPIAMVWSARYILKIEGAHVIPGGRLSLLLLTVTAFVIMGLQLFIDLGVLRSG